MSILVALLVVVVSALPLSRPADAGWTPDYCDGGNKYWCYSVYYVTISGGVEIQTRWMNGARDGGYDWWLRHTVQDWRFDGSTWYFLESWGESSTHYNVNPWESEATTYWVDVANEGIVRQQYKGEINVSPFPVQCDQYVDWHLTTSGATPALGMYTCL
jgi:hypothetical protein